MGRGTQNHGLGHSSAQGKWILYLWKGTRGWAAITLDTGATHTFISMRFFRWIPKFKRPTLHGPGTLKQAGYGVIPILGRALFDLQLGPLKIKRLLTVAKIRDDVLLGFDNLSNDKALGPADILYSRNILKLGQHAIPLRMVNYLSMNRSLKDDEEILGLCEKVIDVFLERTPTCQDGDSMLVETSPEFGEKYRCVLTPVVVSSKGKVTARI